MTRTVRTALLMGLIIFGGAGLALSQATQQATAPAEVVPPTYDQPAQAEGPSNQDAGQPAQELGPVGGHSRGPSGSFLTPTGWLVCVLFPVGAIVLVVLLILALSAKHKTSASAGSAGVPPVSQHVPPPIDPAVKAKLDMRLASGEIDRDEYRRLIDEMRRNG